MLQSTRLQSLTVTVLAIFKVFYILTPAKMLKCSKFKNDFPAVNALCAEGAMTHRRVKTKKPRHEITKENPAACRWILPVSSRRRWTQREHTHPHIRYVPHSHSTLAPTFTSFCFWLPCSPPAAPCPGLRRKVSESLGETKQVTFIKSL